MNFDPEVTYQFLCDVENFPRPTRDTFADMIREKIKYKVTPERWMIDCYIIADAHLTALENDK